MTIPNDPINNPPIPPIPSTTPPADDQPGLGAGEEAQQPKPFSLPPEPAEKGKTSGATGAAERPTPMEAAKGVGAKISPDSVTGHAQTLLQKINEAQDTYDNPPLGKLEKAHYDAMKEVVNHLQPDMNIIAKYSGQTFEPPQKERGDGEAVIKYIRDYLESSQGASRQTLNFLSKVKNPSVSEMLSVQYAMQRASQKVELLANIIGSTVSGIKTLMSTQLG
ncbi:MAG: hypothetical protein KDK55_00280 [Chlamydiia bacterium]|nr:hypothetical protein [Chlamydiia bacterium]